MPGPARLVVGTAPPLPVCDEEIALLVIGVPGQRPDFPELRLTQPQPRKPTFSKPHPQGSFQPCASSEAAHVGLLAVVALLGHFKKTLFDTFMCDLSVKVARCTS